MAKQKISLNLYAEQIKELRVEADGKRQSLSYIVRELIRERQHRRESESTEGEDE